MQEKLFWVSYFTSKGGGFSRLIPGKSKQEAIDRLFEDMKLMWESNPKLYPVPIQKETWSAEEMVPPHNCKFQYSIPGYEITFTFN